MSEPKTDKCFLCHKRVGLLEFKCRCDNTFCSKHRQPEYHNCSFDYKRLNLVNLTRKLTKLKPDKIIKI